MNPFGPVHIIFTVTGMSIAELNSTMHVRETFDPTGLMGLGLLCVVSTEVGAGTA